MLLSCQRADGVIDSLFGVGLVLLGDRRRTGHPRNVREAGRRCAGQRGAATFQQELTVIDDPGAYIII